MASASAGTAGGASAAASGAGAWPSASGAPASAGSDSPPGGGMFFTGASIEPDAPQRIPEANPINFVSRMRMPKLMMHGKYDEVDAFRTESEPLYKLLGKPKQLLPYEGGHIPDRELFIPAFMGWLDKTLGPVKTN